MCTPPVSHLDVWLGWIIFPGHIRVPSVCRPVRLRVSCRSCVDQYRSWITVRGVFLRVRNIFLFIFILLHIM